jgi:hypothetical protein
VRLCLLAQVADVHTRGLRVLDPFRPPDLLEDHLLGLSGTKRPTAECVSIAFCGFASNLRELRGEAAVGGACALRLRTL